jgi:rare lipoprotein A
VVKVFAALVIVPSMVLASSLTAPAAQLGMASYYRNGKVTANGEKFNPQGLTAAHRTLPFGTKVRVINVGTGKAVVVRINDRGPFIRGRIIDLALGAARAVGLHRLGVAKVRLEVLK